MSEPDDYSLTFRERAIIEATANKVVQKLVDRFPSMGNSNISWGDFLYSLAKGAAAMVLGFVALASLWAVVAYLKAGAPSVPGVTH